MRKSIFIGAVCLVVGFSVCYFSQGDMRQNMNMYRIEARQWEKTANELAESNDSANAKIAQFKKVVVLQVELNKKNDKIIGIYADILNRLRGKKGA
jgi:hypothetical protein